MKIKSPGALLLIAKKKNGEKPDNSDDYKNEPESKGGNAKEDAGMQLSEAIDSGSGQAIYDAICDIIRLERE